ncbi:ribosome maturation factor RimM [Caloramator australicus]|uniref:Ribosome maturation factor RimM n=1 Tax=Caloramator australicus RC3 TaxID=857293 RepID=G0V3Z7_9CLOT|nr:ribosome maturation factor RimM [Caloramator australicus]CCC57837.1 16S rRNA processing protein RimM [Caloramator australicus RC3]
MIKYLKIGKIINTHGIKGEVKIYPLTDDIKRFDKLKFVFFKRGDLYEKVNVQGVKYFKNLVILKLEGIDDMNAAEKIKNDYIYIDRENAVELPEDTYFIADLIGMDVVNIETDEKVGRIISVFSTGSNDVYEIKMDNGKIILIPAIKDVVKHVDVENSLMKIKLIEGLI